MSGEKFKTVATILNGEERKYFFLLSNIWMRSRFRETMTDQQLEQLRDEMWDKTDLFLQIINRKDLISLV